MSVGIAVNLNSSSLTDKFTRFIDIVHPTIGHSRIGIFFERFELFFEFIFRP